MIVLALASPELLKRADDLLILTFGPLQRHSFENVALTVAIRHQWFLTLVLIIFSNALLLRLNFDTSQVLHEIVNQLWPLAIELLLHVEQEVVQVEEYLELVLVFRREPTMVLLGSRWLDDDRWSRLPLATVDARGESHI